MNKIKYCKIICLILSITLIFSSCFSKKPNVNNDREISNEYFEKLIIALQNKDKAAFKDLFSKQSIESDNFDKNMDSLFDLYKGTKVISYDDCGYLNSNGSVNHGVVLNWILCSYDVDTDAGVYRFAIKLINIDDADKDNVGILSLYFTKAEDSDMLNIYQGNDNWAWTVGINIEEFTPINRYNYVF